MNHARSRIVRAGLLGAIALLLTFAGTSLLTSPVTAAATGDAFVLDPGHSFVYFQIEHMGIAPAFGRFNDISGSASVDEGVLTGLNFSVKTASVDTGNDRRDGHLKSPDFFNAKTHAEITFKADQIEKQDGHTYHVHGTLTMLGKARKLVVPIEFKGPKQDPWGKTRAGIGATFTIKRSDFGMNYGIENGALGDEVSLMIGIEVAR